MEGRHTLLRVVLAASILLAVGSVGLAHHRPGHQIPPGHRSTTTTTQPTTTSAPTTTTLPPSTTTTAPTTTTTAPTTTTTAPSGYSPPAGVSATPSTLGSVINVQPTGTIIILEDGIYNVNQIGPKAGQQLWARNLHQAIIEGGGVRHWAFVNHNTSSPTPGVELHGLRVRNYLGSPGNGPVGGGGAWGWVYEDLWLHHNKHSGIGFGRNSVIRRVTSCDNGETGISSPGPQGTLIEDTVLCRNGFGQGFNWRSGTGSTGGMKILNTSGTTTGAAVTVRNSVAYDNHGPGFWIDFVLNTPVTFANVEAHNNDGPGFFLEASRPGPILVTGCTVTGTKNWHGIYISGAQLVTVENCSVDGRGIMVSEDNTGNRSVRDALIRNNTMTNMVAGSHGAQSQSGVNIFDPNRIRFRDNSYPGVSGSPFRWAGQNLSYAQWQAIGQD